MAALLLRPPRGGLPLLFLAIVTTLSLLSAPSALAAAPAFDPKPTTANCTELWMEQPVDQFNYNEDAPTWLQRYYVCSQFWNASDPLAPLFFYAGNEGALPNRLNNTGLVWELGALSGALLVWGEHRFYGESMPVNGSVTDPAALESLSIQQALADFVKLIQFVKEDMDIPDAPVVAFGGSYGGNLAAWLRMRYPEVVYAALASSAPLRCQLVDGQGWDPTAFWQVVTRTASPEAGVDAAPACVPNSRAAFAALFDLAATPEGRAAAEEALSLCPGVLANDGDATMVALFLRNAWDTGAMSSYAFPSSYFTGDPAHPLPAWPIKVMCKEMAGELQTPEELLGALSRATSVIWNATEDPALECYSQQFVTENALQTGSAYFYQVCSEFVPNESFFPSNASSMFWAQNLTDVDPAALEQACRATFGPSGPLPDFTAAPLLYGTDPGTSSRIILWNGLLDPWSSGGILANASDTVVAVVDPQGGHHADLNWSSPDDTPSLRATRAAEAALLRGWLAQYRASSA